MLAELRIRDFAIIDQLTLALAPGFTVLTGETGAGKSIIVGALGLLLGERASADVVRTGCEKAVVEGTFDAEGRPELLAALDAHGIDADSSTVVLRREVAATGRTRAWVNGTTVTAGVLAELGRHLVDLHGQHEAQTLLDEASQRDILDAFAGATAEAAAVRAAHEALQAAKRDLASLARRKADAEKRADYLRHVVQEIEGARLVEGEDERLEEEARRLEHADELRALAAQAAGALEGDDDGVLSQLAQVQRLLGQLQRLDPGHTERQGTFDTAFYALEALARELADYAAEVELDPARLAQVQQRRELLFKLMKKHGPALTDVIRTGREARAELDLVDSASLDLKTLTAREAAAQAELASAAGALTKKRTAAAKRLGEAVSAGLPPLGMPDGRFGVALLPRSEVAADGAEGVEFRVTLNAGHEQRALSRVASGGELARVMLALKTILATIDRIPTLVFDEVDAGIGGRVGLQVGDAMRALAAHHQVFAITHLPQIAARGHHHIRVTKGAKGGVTTADVGPITAGDRVTEIARMLGGDPESAVSQAHAQELLAGAEAGGAGGAATSTASSTPGPRTAAAGRRRR